jgi:phage-related protein
MNNRFNIELLADARSFLLSINEKARNKVLFNIGKAQKINDPKILKKLNSEIWEFRTEYNGIQYRLLAFWDKRNNKNTLVICTHGFIKKTDKVPLNELNKAYDIMRRYFEKF